MTDIKYNKGYIFAISLIAAMGGLLFGYDWVVIGGAKPFYENYFGITNLPYMQGWTMSSALIGCLFGAMVAGALSDKLGRKKLLLAAALLFLVSAWGTGAANNLTIFIVARLLSGVGIGIASNLSPLYIAEVAPAHIRGKLVSINQLTIVLGIFSAQLINWLIAEDIPTAQVQSQIAASWNGQIGWRWMFWSGGVPALFFLVFMLLVPESPRWLVMKNRNQKALMVLKKIGNHRYAEHEMAQIAASTPENSKVDFRILLSPRLRFPLLIGVVLAVFQQWCGINVIFNYAQEIFEAAGYGLDGMLLNILVTGVVMVVFSVAGMFTVDIIGRRFLLVSGSILLAVIYAFMGAFYYFGISGWPIFLMMILAIAVYSMTLATVTWVVLSEIFPNRIRGAAMAVATFSLWAACFVLTFTFPLLNSSLGTSGTFWLYGLVCIGGFLFIFFKLPETKGKMLEEIEKQLEKY